MAEGPAVLSGPDFERGVPLSSVADDELLLGHAGGEPVLLVRSGGELFAVGASCSHYGASMAEGLLVDGTVRCPAHHAAFSIRTGEAVRAPALNPIPCWTVEQRDGCVFVTGKRERSTAPREVRAEDAASHPASVVIVGAGAAGSAAAETLRSEGYGGRSRCSRRTIRLPTTGRTFPRTILPAARPRSGSRSGRPNSTRRTG